MQRLVSITLLSDEALYREIAAGRAVLLGHYAR